MDKLKHNLVLAIDFDGTICVEDFPDVGEMKEGADVYINKLYDEGHHIVINTCRSGIHEGAAETFLRKNKIRFHYINSNMPYLIEQYGQDCRKISADIYVDDKCLLGLPDSWKEIYELIKKREKEILG